MSEDKNDYKTYQTIYLISPPPSSPAWNLDGEERKSVEITMSLSTYEQKKDESAEEQRAGLQYKLNELRAGKNLPNCVVTLKSIKSIEEVISEIKLT